MARLEALNWRAGCVCLAAAGLGVAFFAPSLRADTAQTNAAPKQAATAPAPSAPQAKAPATNTVAAPRTPDTFNRYGKIWAPSDDAAHPIRLNVQFPGVGEVKIPSEDELLVRDKLDQLTTLSDAEIHKQLDQWPPYSKMKLGDQGQLLMRIQQFREQRTRVAMQAAHDMGLLTLTNDQKAHFEKEYWDKTLKMDHELVKQFDPVYKASEQKLQDELYREFSVIAPTPAANKPPAAAPPTNNISLANKLAAPSASAPQIKDTTSGQQPMAQGPPR